MVDTNVFLEILLNQAARRKCEAFLQGEKGAAWISDFTLHSIGVLLFRQKRPDLFNRFTADTLPQFSILSLSEAGYSELAQVSTRHGLDFDDAYQFSVARENKLAIATQDKDFQRVRNVINVRLL
jgi:predicted nucleic acid-binding protein